MELRQKSKAVRDEVASHVKPVGKIFTSNARKYGPIVCAGFGVVVFLWIIASIVGN